ncbi:MAG: HK97 family phage prohead protease [Alphaproteobacteria bacterium]|nr:HK97 family phage prohead protease [Alphaproteobacteria bacterium]
MNIQHMTQPLAVKSLAADGLFVGYASVFGNVDSYNEIVAKGAFQRSLAAWQAKNAAPAMLWMHDPTIPIGLWVAMAEDENGLVVQGRLALSTQKGREAYELLKMKALTGLSIGYRVVTSKIDGKRKARVLTDVELFEVSLVTFPANDAARISVVKTVTKRPLSKAKGKTDTVATRAVVARLKKAARVLKEKNPRRNKG